MQNGIFWLRRFSGFCENGSEILDSIKGAESLDKLRNSFIHKKCSTGYLVSLSVS
jgi:hypothetical protein